MGLLLLTPVFAFVGCDDDPPPPVGNLERPAGMAFIARDPELVSTASGTAVLRRSDVLVADSEAQGVRIIQFAEEFDSTGLRGFLPPFFVPAPVAFFKLAVEAPGFPTRVDTAPDDMENALPARAYVIAPSRGRLHVLEIGPIPYQAPATVDTNVRIGEVDLLSLSEGGPPLTPIDLVRLGRREDRSADYVMVLLGGLGLAPSQLALLEIGTGTPPQLLSSSLVEISPGASGLVYRPEERRILVSSSVTSSIAEVEIAGTSSAGSLAFGAVVGIDAGGPTGSMVDAAGSGVLAFRVDRSAAVWLRPAAGGGFERPEELLPSPFDDPDSVRTTPEPGVLTLTEPLAVLGAYGRLSQLGLPGRVEQGFLFEDEAGRDIVLVVHADGIASYVQANPSPALLASENPSVPFAYTSDFEGGEPLLNLPICGTVSQCVSTGAPDDFCPDAGPTIRPFVGLVDLRVAPFGRLTTGTDATFQFLGMDDGTLTADIFDPSEEDFDDFSLRVADSVRLELSVPGCEGATTETEISLSGELLGVGQGDARGARLRVQVRTSTPADVLDRCGLALQQLDQVVRYEVHVSDTIEEAVLSTEFPVRTVLERVPITRSTRPDGTSVAQMSFGAEPTTPIEMVVESAPSDGDPVEALRCSIRSAATDDTLGPCASASDCGAGRVCEGADPPCFGTCASECVGECFESRTDRVCPRLDLRLTGTDVQIDLGTVQTEFTNNQTPNAGSAPSHAIYHPHLEAFFVSFPGSRTIIEVPTTPAGAVLESLR